MMSAAFSSVRRSVTVRCWSIAASSQSSLTGPMFEMSLRPEGVIDISVLRPSVGSDLALTSPSSRKAATVSAIDWGRTCSATASALTVIGPASAIRARVVICDHVQRMSSGADSARSRARSRIMARGSRRATSRGSGAVMDEHSISLEPVAIARHPVLFTQVTCLDTLCNVVTCSRLRSRNSAGLSTPVMRESATTTTLSTSALTIDARRTALMLMDFQPAILGQVPDRDALMDKAQIALAWARAHGVKVVFVRVAFVPDDYDAIPHHHKAFGAVKQNHLLAEGNPSFDIDPALEVRACDTVVRKSRFGAFNTTDLRIALSTEAS